MLNTAEALQRWENQRPVETIVKQPGRPLPDADELNAKIPKKRWEKGLDGQLRAPWVKQHIAYLLDPKDASVFTFINSTVGARIAVERLERQGQDDARAARREGGADRRAGQQADEDAVRHKTKTALHHPRLAQLRRPAGGERARGAAGRPTIEQIGQPVKLVSVKEELDDEIGF